MELTTALRRESQVLPGVAYTIRQVSFGGRLQLTRQISELLRKYQFHEAGDSPADRAEAACLAGEIDRLYLEWGLLSVDGLIVDGRNCDAAAAIECAPERLCAEILSAIKRECALPDEERKN